MAENQVLPVNTQELQRQTEYEDYVHSSYDCYRIRYGMWEEPCCIDQASFEFTDSPLHFQVMGLKVFILTLLNISQDRLKEM